MARKNTDRIKREDTYNALREKGHGKEKSARIANAQADPNRNPSANGGKSSKYESWSKEKLYKKAKELGIEDYANMNKGELIHVLREQ